MNDEVQLASFFLLTLSINQIIPTTNNTRFCMNVPKQTSLKPTHQKTLVCVIIVFPSPTVTNYLTRYLTLGGTLHYTTL